MRKSLLICTFCLILILLFAGTGFSAEPFVLPDISGNDKVRIFSDRMELSRDGNKVFLYDDVKLVQNNSEFFADKMIGFYSKDNKNGKIVGQNKTVTNFSKIDAYGNVKFLSEKIKATGKKGNYNFKKNEIEITGDVFVNEKGVVANGDKFVYNLKTKEAKMFGGNSSNKRVTIVLDSIFELEERIEKTEKNR